MTHSRDASSTAASVQVRQSLTLECLSSTAGISFPELFEAHIPQTGEKPIPASSSANRERSGKLTVEIQLSHNPNSAAVYPLISELHIRIYT